jgi:hypothetical protein
LKEQSKNKSAGGKQVVNINMFINLVVLHRLHVALALKELLSLLLGKKFSMNDSFSGQAHNRLQINQDHYDSTPLNLLVILSHL